MHSAPAVTYPVRRSRAGSRLLCAIWLLGATGVALAVAWQEGVGTREGVLLTSALLAGALACGWGGYREFGRVRFDGQYWSWSGRSPLAAARMEVGLDLQILLLVRLVEPERPSRWLWLERGSDPQRWLDLRRAVYSRAPAASPVVPASMR